MREAKSPPPHVSSPAVELVSPGFRGLGGSPQAWQWRSRRGLEETNRGTGTRDIGARSSGPAAP